MKPYLIMLLLFSVLLQSFSKVFIVSEYSLNKAFIAEYLCENKAVPELECEGKCHLKKQLDTDTEKEQSQQAQKKITLADYVLQPRTTIVSAQPHFTYKQKLPLLFCSGMPVAAYHAVFHPPKA